MSVQQSVHNKSSVSRLWLHRRLPHPVRAIADRYVCGYAAQPVRYMWRWLAEAVVEYGYVGKKDNKLLQWLWKFF